MFRFYRQSKLIWFALLALSLFWLLPLIDAAQLAYQPTNTVQATLCSSISKPTATKSETPPSPPQHIKQCALCINSNQQDWALPAAPVVLPSVQQHTSPLQLVGNEGFFIPVPSYTLPQSQAPPIV
jgi:hypothetical protein